MIVSGGCHCGLVRFDASIDAPEVELRSCDCSICRMSGHLHLIVPESRFRLTEGRRETTTYKFATGKARHLFCTQCGIKSFLRPKADPNSVSINWHCLDEDHGLTATIVPLSA